MRASSSLSSATKPSFDSGSQITAGNRLITQRLVQRAHARHLERLDHIKPVVDLKPPATLGHMVHDAKKHMLRGDRARAIDRDNRLLLGRLQHIMTRDHGQLPPVGGGRRPGPVSLNDKRRRDENFKVTKDNERIMRRLMSQKPFYSKQQFEKDFHRSQSVVRLRALYPPTAHGAPLRAGRRGPLSPLPRDSGVRSAILTMEREAGEKVLARAPDGGFAGEGGGAEDIMLAVSGPQRSAGVTGTPEQAGSDEEAQTHGEEDGPGSATKLGTVEADAPGEAEGGRGEAEAVAEVANVPTALVAEGVVGGLVEGAD